MNKVKFSVLILFFMGAVSFAQNSSQKAKNSSPHYEKPYHPEENAQAKINTLIKKAKKEHKNILIQAGGNWCVWCLRFTHFIKTHSQLSKILNEHYLVYHLNWSRENKNEKIFERYGYPGKKYGYPVFIVLDKNGTQIHTQNSALLEEGKSYNPDKVKAFFKKWKPHS